MRALDSIHSAEPRRRPAMRPDRDSPTTRPAAIRPMAVGQPHRRVVEGVGDASGSPCVSPRVQPRDQIAGRERQRHHQPRREVAVVHERPERRAPTVWERPVEQCAAPSRAGRCRPRPARARCPRCARTPMRTPPRAKIARAHQNVRTTAHRERKGHPAWPPGRSTAECARPTGSAGASSRSRRSTAQVAGESASRRSGGSGTQLQRRPRT